MEYYRAVFKKMNNTEKNKNVVNFRIPPARMDELQKAAESDREKSSNVFCKKIIIFFLDLQRDGVSFKALSSSRREIVRMLRKKS